MRGAGGVVDGLGGGAAGCTLRDEAGEDAGGGAALPLAPLHLPAALAAAAHHHVVQGAPLRRRPLQRRPPSALTCHTFKAAQHAAAPRR